MSSNKMVISNLKKGMKIDLTFKILNKVDEMILSILKTLEDSKNKKKSKAAVDTTK